MIKNLNEQTSELIGLHVGDGTLYKTNWSVVWELRGSLDEKEFYLNNIKNLLESIFKEETFKPKFRSGGKNGCFGIQTSKKVVTSFFLDFGFFPGRKTHTVTIPDYILNADDNIKFSFIRGYFDTDGYIRFERINNRKTYDFPKIEFATASRNLRDNLFSLLIELGYKPYKWGKKYYKICLAGKSNLEKFIKEVSPKNKKHLNKYFFWKKYGYCSPNAEVAQSGTAQS